MEIDRPNEDVKEKSGELDHQSEPKILHDSQGTQSDSHRSDKNELQLTREIDRGWYFYQYNSPHFPKL